jgi:hypothetical protein
MAHTAAHLDRVLPRAPYRQWVFTVPNRCTSCAQSGVEIELAPRQVARPISFAPDVWIGVTSRLTAGLIWRNASVSRIARSASYCFDHTVFGCDRTYHNQPRHALCLT